MGPRLPVPHAYPLKLLGRAVDDREAAQLARQQQQGGSCHLILRPLAGEQLLTLLQGTGRYPAWGCLLGRQGSPLRPLAPAAYLPPMKHSSVSKLVHKQEGTRHLTLDPLSCPRPPAVTDQRSCCRTCSKPHGLVCICGLVPTHPVPAVHAGKQLWPCRQDCVKDTGLVSISR